ncbi:MAG: YbaB/EbfC family nucleoid-associated protein [Chloroflexi bacterium]|nr:YbaB/EbfC family nucleoid-associated protein [Chloroflexota bacterium]
MLKQIEQMQAQMMKAQEELGEMTVEGSAGGGAVTVVMNGHQQVQRVTIDPEFVDPEDVETLQDAIVAALHDAQQKAQDLMQSKMGAVTGGLGGLGLPGLP